MSDLVAELRADAVRIGKKQGIDKERLSLWRAADEIEALQAENFKLAAGVCEHRLGNEHGNAYCGVTGKLL